MTEKVLIIDDEPNVLAGLRRHLRKSFDILTAESGDEALRLVKTKGPFAVVVCDMHMPGMNGIEVLGRLRTTAPDTVRMMLTGNADQQTAADAVNEGNVFRFLTKPCSRETLTEGIGAGIRQYKFFAAERELLEKTLTGSVKVLTDILSAVNPEAFGQAEKVRAWASALAIPMGLKQPWKMVLAAMLAPIGLVAAPPELLTKKAVGGSLTSMEQEILAQFPLIGRGFITNIPRLKDVAEIVAYHTKCFDGSGVPDDMRAGQGIPIEARILKILYDLAAITATEFPTSAQFDALEKNRGLYDPAVLAKARKFLATGDSRDAVDNSQIVDVSTAMLHDGDLLYFDLLSTEGYLLLAAGTRLSTVMIERLRWYKKLGHIVEPIKVARKLNGKPASSKGQHED